MMVVDASAILAILLEESDADLFEERLIDADAAVISPVNYWEVVIRMLAVFGPKGRDMTEEYIGRLNITVAPIGPDIARSAALAAEHYGRGKPAKLNLGDTFAYALAQQEGDGLLYKGDDFSRTDVINALTGKPGPA